MEYNLLVLMIKENLRFRVLAINFKVHTDDERKRRKSDSLSECVILFYTERLL